MRAQLFVIPFWLALAACASSPSPNGERIDAAFRAIQRGEARLERAARQLEQAEASIAPGAGACVERCAPAGESAEEASGGARDVCDRAAELDDGDARTRCERARARARAVEQRADALWMRCGCGPRAGGGA